MRITVLGKSPAWQDAGGACSGYLVEADGYCVLLDCGCGVFGKLRRHREYWEVDAVVVSHLHADHILDLVPYASALTYAPRQQPVPVDRWHGTDSPARPRLIAPPGATVTPAAPRSKRSAAAGQPDRERPSDQGHRQRQQHAGRGDQPLRQAPAAGGGSEAARRHVLAAVRAGSVDT